MDILLMIDNNLQNDNRVKRHISLMLEKGNRVNVIARPIPNDQPSFIKDNLTYTFWNTSNITLDPTVIKSISEKLGVYDMLWRAFPGIQTPVEKAVVMAKYYKKIQEIQLKSSWWEDFRSSIALEGVNEINEHANLLWSFEFFLRWAEFTSDFKADLIYCNDIGTLLCGVAHKLKWNSKLVYDAHEIQCDLVPEGHSRLWKNTIALYENSLIQYADEVIGVSESHVNWMKKTYGINKVTSIPNCSSVSDSLTSPEKHFENELRLYYHGASDQWRGLSNIVMAISKVSNVRLVLRCVESEHLKEIKKIVRTLKIEDRVEFEAVVDSSEIIEVTRRDGDIGIHACDVRPCLNIEVALSNKFIEYLKAGLPIITSPLIEQERIVRDNNIGYVLKDNSVDEIVKSINYMLENKDRLPEMSRKAYEVGKTYFDWEIYKKELWKVIKNGL